MKFNSRVLGRFLEVFFVLMMVVVVASAVINSFFPEWFMGEKVMKAMEDAYGFNIKKLSFFCRGLLIFVGTVGTALMVYGLWLGKKIAQLASHGEMISESSAKLFRQLRQLVLGWGIFNVVQCLGTYQFLMPKIEFKMMIWSMVFMSISHLFIFIFVASIAAVIGRSARLKADQDLTV